MVNFAKLPESFFYGTHNHFLILLSIRTLINATMNCSNLLLALFAVSVMKTDALFCCSYGEYFSMTSTLGKDVSWITGINMLQLINKHQIQVAKMHNIAEKVIIETIFDFSSVECKNTSF